jgi:hypothetical protein
MLIQKKNKILKKRKGLFWLTVLKVLSIISGLHHFGTVVRQYIMVGARGRGKPLTSQAKE